MLEVYLLDIEVPLCVCVTKKRGSTATASTMLKFCYSCSSATMISGYDTYGGVLFALCFQPPFIAGFRVFELYSGAASY